MRHNICARREDGDFDVLVSVETDTLGKDAVNDIIENLMFSLADEYDFDLVIIKTEDVHVLSAGAGQ